MLVETFPVCIKNSGCSNTFGRSEYIHIYSGVRVIASRILHEICLLIGELAIKGTKLTLNDRLGTKSNFLIEQYEHKSNIEINNSP